VFARILAAMTCVECGIRMEEVDKESIEEGWKLV
jgi:Zn ribbon nucleic-acid-binding protein